MLEAPEARLFARQLEENLTGKEIETVLVGFSPHKFTWFSHPAEEFGSLLYGRTVTGARSVGGMVELMAGGTSVVFTDGVNFRYIEPPDALPKTHQLLIGFTDQSCLTVSVRMYAGIICFKDGRPEGTLSEYYEKARTKPQVLSDAFTREYFMSIATAPEVSAKSAKALLATEQRIPGLGNGVLQDILFHAGIHPKTKVSALGTDDLDRIYDSVRDILWKIYRQGGRDCETDIFGRKGGYKAVLSKDTVGQECPLCARVIIKENYLGGSIYYCPGCQVPPGTNTPPRGHG